MPLRQEMAPRDYFEVFLRRKWYIVFSVLLCLLGAAVYCAVTPELYKSSTTILVIGQRVPEEYVRSTISTRVDERLFTIRQQVLSRTRLVAVMEELGLFAENRKKQPLEDVVEMMRKRIEIQVVSAMERGRRRDSSEDAFTLTFTHENPQLAMVTASRLASFFINENLKTREQQATGTAEFLESQLKETKARLEVQEERLKEYKLQYMGELPQQLQANLQILSRLQEQMKMNSDAIRVAQDRKAYATAQLEMLEAQRDAYLAQANAASGASRAASGGGEETLPAGDPVAKLSGDLSAKKSQLATLSTKYTGEYPEIRRLKEEIAQLEVSLAEAVRWYTPKPDPKAVHPKPTGAVGGGVPGRAPTSREAEEIRKISVLLAGLESELQSLRKDRNAIEKNIAAMEARVEKSPRREQEMVALTRDYENMRHSYDQLLRKKLDAEVSQNLEIRQKGEQFQILDPADLPQEPFTPNRPKVFGIAFALGLFVGFGGALGVEAAVSTLRSKRDFNRFFQVPVLATIPVIRNGGRQEGINRLKTMCIGGMASFAAVVNNVLSLFGKKITYRFRVQVPRMDRLKTVQMLFQRPVSFSEGNRNGNMLDPGKDTPMFDEQFRWLRAVVEQKTDPQRIKVLGITSSIAGEGKTLTCAQLGMCLAATGRKKTLLVDMDIRKADLTHGMGYHRTPGLSEYLLGAATLRQVLKKTNSPNLFLVSAGENVTSTADLLSGESFKSFLGGIRGLFDIVLLDTPPMLPVADTMTIREMVDGFIVVYRAGFTPYTMFQQTYDALGEQLVLGAVINCLEELSDSYYRKYFGSYYYGNTAEDTGRSGNERAAGPMKDYRGA